MCKDCCRNFLMHTSPKAFCVSTVFSPHASKQASQLSLEVGQHSLCVFLLSVLCLQLLLCTFGSRGATLGQWLSAPSIVGWRRAICPDTPCWLGLHIVDSSCFVSCKDRKWISGWAHFGLHILAKQKHHDFFTFVYICPPPQARLWLETPDLCLVHLGQLPRDHSSCGSLLRGECTNAQVLAACPSQMEFPQEQDPCLQIQVLKSEMVSPSQFGRLEWKLQVLPSTASWDSTASFSWLCISPCLCRDSRQERHVWKEGMKELLPHSHQM